MKTLKLLAILLAFVFAGTMVACNGDDGGDEDADGDVITPDTDVTEDTTPPDQPDVPDVPTEDVTTEDIVTEDVPTEDVPTEELPECTATAGNCGDSLSGTTTAAGVLDGYVCLGRPVDWHETSGEVIWEVTPTAAGTMTLSFSAGGGTDPDMDVFVLSSLCDVETCIAYGDRGTAFPVEAGTTYYVVVDTYRDYFGAFTLDVTCGEPVEICDNGTDDNANTYTDCDDPLCFLSPHCFETDCGDSTDNDGDGDTDCEDGDCWGATSCRGSGAVGDPCDSMDDCASGQCVLETGGWPGGYCVVYNGDAVCTELTCPSGSTCIEMGMFGGAPAGCFFDCSSASCRAGYDCDADASSTCWPACTDNAQCVETGYCNTETGNCEIPPELCTGGVDEDGDTLIDCADPDCTFTSDCVTYTTLAGGETCASAVALTMPSGERGIVGVSGDTTGAADDTAPGCASGTGGLDVAYSFTLTAAASVQVNLQGITLTDTVVYVRQDCAGADVACNDDYSGLDNSYVTFSATAGTYYVIVDAYSSTYVGTYNLAVNFVDP